MLRTIRGSLSLLSRRQKIAVGLLAVATLVVNSLDIVAIALLGLIGSVALGGKLPAQFDWVSGYDQTDIVLLLLAVTSIVFAVKTVTGVILTGVRQKFLAKLEVHFSRQIAGHIFSGGLAEIKRNSRAHLEWSILRSTGVAFGAVVGQALQLFAEVSLAIFILALFFYTDLVSAIAVLAYFAIVLGVFQAATRSRLAATGTNFTAGSISVGQAITDIVSAFREISVIHSLSFFVDRLMRSRSQVALAQATQITLQAIPRLIVELALIIGAIAFTGFQFSRTDGNPDVGLVSVFIVGSLRMMSAMLPLYRAFIQLRFQGPQAQASQTFVRDAIASNRISRTPPQVRPTGLPKLETPTFEAPEVELTGVSFAYESFENSRLAVEDVSLRISPGTTVALIGPSGAGKSTLVDLLLGLYEPSKGSIKVGGMSPEALRALRPGFLNYVPQKPGLIGGTVRDNIALGVEARDVDSRALADSLRLAQIEELISSLPYGLETPLGKHNDDLSGGQLQRIGLARALYTRPGLLVLDEATSALDGETEAAVTEALNSLGTGITKIIIAHRLSTIQHADRVFVIDHGRLVGSGSLKHLEETSPLVKRYVALMSLK